MHKETCSLLACFGPRGQPARRHARKLKRGGRGHCAAVRVQCTDTSGGRRVSPGESQECSNNRPEDERGCAESWTSRGAFHRAAHNQLK